MVLFLYLISSILYNFYQNKQEVTNLLDVLAGGDNQDFVKDVSQGDACCQSDHKMVLASLSLGLRQSKPMTFLYRLIKRIDICLFE